MYQNANAEIRHDLNTFVEEAQGAEQYYIGPKLMPMLPTKAKAGVYPKIEIAGGQLLKAESTVRHPSGTYNEVGRKATQDTYSCVDRGLEERIDDVFSSDMSRFFDVEVLTSKLIMRSMMLDYEIRVAGKIFDTTVFNTEDSAVEMSEGNLATMDFPKEIMSAKERLTSRANVPNTIVMNDVLFNRIRRSAKLQTFLYGTIGAGTQYRLVNAQDIASAFNVPQVLIAAGTQDTAAKGQEASLARVWSEDYIWVGNVQEGDFSAMGAGRTIVWTDDSPSLFVTESYRDEKRRGDMIRVRHHTDEKIVDATSAEIIKVQNQ